MKDFGLFKVFQEVYKTGKPQRRPISLYQDQKITGWKENHVYKLPSGEIVEIYDDTTERKQVEETVHHRKQKIEGEEHLQEHERTNTKERYLILIYKYT